MDISFQSAKLTLYLRSYNVLRTTRTFRLAFLTQLWLEFDHQEDGATTATGGLHCWVRSQKRALFEFPGNPLLWRMLRDRNSRCRGRCGYSANMEPADIRGVHAALLTPRHSDDSVNVPAVERLVMFLRERAIQRFVANGATGEFCLTTPDQLRTLVRAIRKVAGDDAIVIAGVGGPSITRVVELAHIARNEGAHAILVPAPYFFPYQQEDIEAFYHAVAERVSSPIILYNLPQFTSGLLAETVCRLIRDVPNIIGIKDSSGSLDILHTLTADGISGARILGNDGILEEAVRRGECDAVVSGVACVVPELVRAVCERGHLRSAHRAGELLREFVAVLDGFPVPWGLRWALEARGIVPAWSAQPLSQGRMNRAREMMAWFRGWYPDLPDGVDDRKPGRTSKN